MKKTYESPKLFIDEYAADTMIASNGGLSGSSAKNGAPDFNQNCWGCDYEFAQLSPGDSNNVCFGHVPGFCD